MMETPRLHDASFLRVVLLWDEIAEATLVFRVHGPRTVVLRASGVASLTCPHENPWGPSISVNEIHGPFAVREGVERIEVEVQSGDTIVIEAASFEWAESESDPVSSVRNDDGQAPE